MTVYEVCEIICIVFACVLAGMACFLRRRLTKNEEELLAIENKRLDEEIERLEEENERLNEKIQECRFKEIRERLKAQNDVIIDCREELGYCRSALDRLIFESSLESKKKSTDGTFDMLPW